MTEPLLDAVLDLARRAASAGALAESDRGLLEQLALAALERSLADARDEGVALYQALAFLVSRHHPRDASALLRGERNHVVAAQPDPDGGPVRLRARRISKQWADTLLLRFDQPAEAGDDHLVQISAPIEVGGERIGALQLVLGAEDRDRPDLELVALVAAALGRVITDLRARARAARDDRLALVGQMMSSLLHDLRNPLSALTGYVELLAEEPDAAARAELARRAVGAVDALEAMSQEVLEFARGTTHAPAAGLVPVPEVLADLEAIAVPDLRRFGTELRVDDQGSGAVRADPVRLRRVLANLVRNAGEAGARLVTVTARRDADHVVLEVADDGPGIHDEVRDRLFQPFATFGKSGGTGLGLAMARRVVEAHGGTLEAPPSAAGAVFRVTLPAS
jgi:signal transduction histidine kinase